MMFQLLTVSFLPTIRSAVIGAFRSSYCSIVLVSSCSLSGPLLYRSPVVVFFDHGHPCFEISAYDIMLLINCSEFNIL